MSWIKFDKNDAMPEKLRPMGSYFQTVVNRNNFVKEVNDLTKGEGDAIEGYLACTFPKQLNESDLAIGEGFDGVEFSMFEDKISVNVPTFRKYLLMVCDAYLQEHPEDRAQIEEYLARSQPPLEEGALPEWRRRRDAGEYPKPLSDI